MDVIADDSVNPNNPIIWSGEFRGMLGFSDETEFPNELHSWVNVLHPDNLKNTVEKFTEHITDRTGATPYDIEFRMKTKLGEYRYFRATGETVRKEAGTPINVAGALMELDFPHFSNCRKQRES